MSNPFNTPGLVLIFFLLPAVFCVSSCELQAGNEIVKGQFGEKHIPLSGDAAWMLLSGALVLSVAGALCYAKGAVEGLREDDFDGRPVVVRNGTTIAGQVLLAIGVAGIIFACIVLL